MPRKRDAASSEPSSVKRRKLDDNTTSQSQSPSSSKIMSQGEREELIRWLDESDQKGQPMFALAPPPTRKGAKKVPPSVLEQPLILNEIHYMTARYSVKPLERWSQMAKYKKFTVGGQTYGVGDCVLVMNPDGSDRDWKAQVHEVRAADEHHVYIRCTWLENAKELLKGVKITPSYHGRTELIPTNGMDIIDAMSVNGGFKIMHWEEADDEARMPEFGEHFWRQTHDKEKGTFSKLRTICKCRKWQNPDHLIVKCSNKACETWLHAACLAERAVQDRQKERTPKAKTGKRGTKRGKVNGANDSTGSEDEDDNGASAEDDTVKAEVVMPESEHPEMVITDKKTGGVTRESVRCLVCKEIIE